MKTFSDCVGKCTEKTAVDLLGPAGDCIDEDI